MAFSSRRQPSSFRAGFNGDLFVVHGAVHVATDDDACEVEEGGAAKIEDEPEVSIRARTSGAEVLVVETRARDRRSSHAGGFVR